MVSVYLQEGRDKDYVLRKIRLPRVPCIGETFLLGDGSGPELDHHVKVTEVKYVIMSSNSQTKQKRKSSLDKIIVYIE